jgi:hypothetical protein
MSLPNTRNLIKHIRYFETTYIYFLCSLEGFTYIHIIYCEVYLNDDEKKPTEHFKYSFNFAYDLVYIGKMFILFR